jgi:cell division protein FtsQ
LNWKKTIVNVLWLFLGAGAIALFGAAMIQKNNKNCSDLKIEITGAEEHLFIDEKDVKDLINKNADLTNKKVNQIDLKGIERELEKTAWVKNAELFFDNNQVLQVRIEERQPVARIFTIQGSSFYVDSAGIRLPLSDKLSARVPMFTNFPSDKSPLSAPDSLLFKGVVDLGRSITYDSFWRAQIAQIYITPQATFELIPVIGDQAIAFGDASDIDSKLNNLYAFYKEAWVQHGINAYEKLDVRFKNQVVATKRGAAIVQSDSTKANEAINALMNGGAINNLVKKDSVGIAKKDTTEVKKVTIEKKKKNKLETNHTQNTKKRINTFSIVKTSDTKKRR